MNPNNELENREEPVPEIEAHDSLSIDEFIKELEAKEKDLHISSDWEIEIEDPEFDDTNPPEFIKQEFSVEPVQPEKKTDPSAVFNLPAASDQALEALESQLLQLRQKVVRMEAERIEICEIMRRRQADFDNYKKRIERDRSDSFVNQLTNLALQMLPVLDNLNRALDFAAQRMEGRSQDFHQFFEGIALVNQQLNEVLAEMGVLPISSIGKDFDPHFHEAVATDSNEDLPANTVTGELLRGYRIGNRVIRAAMVKVSTAKPVISESSRSMDSDSSEDVLGVE